MLQVRHLNGQAAEVSIFTEEALQPAESMVFNEGLGGRIQPWRPERQPCGHEIYDSTLKSEAIGPFDGVAFSCCSML
jgi:hypothetical protein